MVLEYTLADQLGGIGFLAPVSLGFPIYMHEYMKELYNQFCRENYGRSFAYCIQKTVEHLEATAQEYNEAGFRITSQNYAFAGDPALVIGTRPQPQLHIENTEGGYSSVSLTPTQISANIDSFLVTVVVNNLGQAVNDWFTLQINRTFPDGSTELAAVKRFPAPYYMDTVKVYVQTGELSQIAGENFLTVTVDADNEFVEDCETDNDATVKFFVFSELLVPIAPCNFSIVGNPNHSVTLKASIGQPLAPAFELRDGNRYDRTI